jgi:hypothetical protein
LLNHGLAASETIRHSLGIDVTTFPVSMVKPYKLLKTRTNGRYRLVFNSALMSALTQRDAEAFSLALAKLKTDLAALGRPIFLDPDNRIAFDVAVNANADGTWVSRFNSLEGQLYRVKKCFVDGFLQDDSPDFETSFEVVAKFFTMLDREMATLPAIDPGSS